MISEVIGWDASNSMTKLLSGISTSSTRLGVRQIGCDQRLTRSPTDGDSVGRVGAGLG